MLTFYFSIVFFLLGIEVCQILTSRIGKFNMKVKVEFELEPGDDGWFENRQLPQYDEAW